MYHFTDLASAEEALEHFLPSRLSRHAYTLEHISAFMDYLGNPQDTIKAIHIAGTSGKTSTAYYMAALLGQAGQKVGLLTSPHITKISERIQIDLKPLTDKVFCGDLEVFMDLVDKSGIQLTYAELLYAFGYWEFARQRVDYMVIETGLGGTHDATNIVDRRDKVCVITDIGLDHTNVLGSTIREIAENKAGIITLRNPVFTYPQSEAAMKEIERASRRRQADLHTIAPQVSHTVRDLPLFQRRNFGLARVTAEFIRERDGLPILSERQLKTAAAVSIPARMEQLRRGHQTIILDGAHNPQKLQALRESIAAEYPGQPVAVLVSFIKSGGRDLSALLEEVEPLYTHVIATTPPGSNDHRRWYRAREIEEAAKRAGLSSFQIIDDCREAVRALLRRPESILVVTGSLYLHQYIRPLVR